MPTTRQKFLQALGIAAASIGLRPAASSPVPETLLAPTPSNSRMTIRTAGVYQITGRVEWAIASPAVHTLSLRLRDQTLAYSAVVPWDGGPHVQTVTALTFLKDEDVKAVELVAHGNSGGALHTLALPASHIVRVA